MLPVLNKCYYFLEEIDQTNCILCVVSKDRCNPYPKELRKKLLVEQI